MKQIPQGFKLKTDLIHSQAHSQAPARTHDVDYAHEDSLGEEPSGGLLEYWRILERHRGTVILITFLGMLGAFLYTLPQTPIYLAQGTIEIQSMNEDFMHMREVNPTSANGNNYDQLSDLQTQVKILQSRALLTRVVDKMKLENKPLVTGTGRLLAWKKALHLAPLQPTATV